MPYDSLSIANYFLDKANQEGVSVDHLKLQKLVYIAHGWHWAIQKKPLIKDSVQAWPHGPVIPNLYHEFKHYGTSPIRAKAFVYDPTIDETVTYEFDTDPATKESSNEEVRKVVGILDRVWSVYGKLTGLELSNITHQKGTPWYIATQGRTRTELKNVSIPEENIKEHYTQLALSKA